MKIIIGADHRGYNLKKYLVSRKRIDTTAISWVDVGAMSAERSDYPIFAHKACDALRAGKADRAILLCGTGIGMALAANRYHGIRAGVAWNKIVARRAGRDDNVNVLVLPSDFLTSKRAEGIIAAWLSVEFKQGRYAQRLALIDQRDKILR